jgi:protein subunit release factor A
MGIGGLNTVIRVYHKPSGILVEVPNLVGRSQYYAREMAINMIETALTHPFYKGD